MCKVLIMLSALYASCTRANYTSHGLSTLAATVQLAQRHTRLLVWFQNQYDISPEVVAPDRFESAGMLSWFWRYLVRNLRTHSSKCIISSIYPLFGPVSPTLLMNISAIDCRCAFCILRGTLNNANTDLVASSTSPVGGCMPSIVWKTI